MSSFDASNKPDGNDFLKPQPDDRLNHPAPGSHPLPFDEFVNRFLESEPDDARLRFRPGDKVKATRPDLFGYVPAGAEGEVIRLEHPANPMSLKGRHYWVKWDLTPFKIPTPAEWLKGSDAINKPGAEPFITNIQTACSCLDLGLVG